MNGAPGAPVAAGRFFLVDRGAWHAAMALGLDAGVSYLVMARCARGQRRFTAASANVVEARTRVHWRRAKAAINAMVMAGVLQRHRGGTHPLYFLPKVDDMPGSPALRPPVMVLPNELADVGPGGRAPLDLVHETAAPAVALRLLLSLYAACDPEGYGVPAHQLAAVAPRRLAAEMEHHVVWCFGAPREPTSPDGSFADLSALGELERVGLVESRLYVVDGLDEDASEWHPADPDDLGKLAHAAGLRLLSPTVAAEVDGLMVLPVLRRALSTDVHLVRVYRPRFRAANATDPDDDLVWWRERYAAMEAPEPAPSRPIGPAIVVPLKSSKRSRRRDRGRH